MIVIAALGAAIALVWGDSDVRPGTPRNTRELEEVGRRLSGVLPPPGYVVLSPADTGAAAKTFNDGMAAYREGRYADALISLRTARVQGLKNPAVPFFVGVMLLSTDDAATAATEFANVIAAGPSPHVGEAHYFRAKALLRLALFGQAKGELDRAIALLPPAMQRRATTLRDSVLSLGPN